MIVSPDIILSALTDSGFEAKQVPATDILTIAFENQTALGFVLVYETTERLLGSWRTDSEALLKRYGFLLRNAGEKAWNVYVVLLSIGRVSDLQIVQLSKIEEDLSSMRKIARVVAADSAGVRSGLLSLLNIQNPPILEPVDMVSEIRMRVSDLPVGAVDAFLSNAPPNEVVRLMGRPNEA